MDVIDFLKTTGKGHLTWEEVGAKFGLTDNAARNRWRRYIRSTQHSPGDKTETQAESQGKPQDSSVEDFVKSIVVPVGMEISSVWQDAAGNFKFSLKKVTSVEESAVDLENLITDLVTKYVPSTFPVTFQPHIGEYSQDTLLMFTSDKHIGASMDKEGVYDVDYNEEVFRRRLEYLAQYIINKAQLSDGFKDVLIFDLGDALDGYEGHTTRGGHLLPQNMTSEEQWDVYVESHLDLAETLLQADVADTLHFYFSSNSNHGGAFEYTAMKALAEILEARYGSRVVCDVSRDFITKYQVFANGEYIHYLTTHGKDKKYMNRGFPLHMNEKTEKWINDYLYEYDLLGERVVFVKGDLHQPSMEKLKHFEYINTPSIFGSSDWIIHNFGLTNPATYCEIIDSDGNRLQSFIDLSSVK